MMNERQNKALSEAIRRYPDAIMALAFFIRASGLMDSDPNKEVLEWFFNYPDDGGLKEPVREFGDTFNAFDMIKEHFTK